MLTNLRFAFLRTPFSFQFSQRLFKPVSRFPYVGQAQPSKNDSAVSSSFSSEANRARGGGGGAGGSYSLRMVRDEQKRINPQLMATFPVSLLRKFGIQ
jgi:hypothetical protein